MPRNNKMSVIAYIGFGANLGDPLVKLDEALNELGALKGTRLESISSAYETKPIGLVDGGPNFINAVIAIQTDITAENLISKMREIEKKLGKSIDHKSDLSRIIDLDLLFYGSETINTDDLIVPHPRLAGRAFVLGPMAEIAPDFEHPLKRKSITELLKNLGYDELQTLKLVRRN